MSTPNGTTSDAMVVADVAHIAWAVNMGCLGFHPWPLRADDPGHTDELRIDLDPSPGVDFAMLREAAHELHAFFDELGIPSFPKTTGNRGIHVYVRLAAPLGLLRRAGRRGGRGPRARAAPTRAHHRGVVEGGAGRAGVRRLQPERAPQDRVRRVVRAAPRGRRRCRRRSRGTSSTTIDPDELTIAVVAERMAADGDPWAAMDDDPQSIEPLLDRWRADIDAGVGDAPWPPVYPKMPHEPPRVAPCRAKPTEMAPSLTSFGQTARA